MIPMVITKLWELWLIIHMNIIEWWGRLAFIAWNQIPGVWLRQYLIGFGQWCSYRQPFGPLEVLASIEQRASNWLSWSLKKSNGVMICHWPTITPQMLPIRLSILLILCFELTGTNRMILCIRRLWWVLVPVDQENSDDWSQCLDDGGVGGGRIMGQIDKHFK